MFSCPFKLLETALFNAYPTPRLALSSKLHKNINCKYLVLDSFLLDVVVSVRRGPFLAHISLSKEKLLLQLKQTFLIEKHLAEYWQTFELRERELESYEEVQTDCELTHYS